MIRGRDRRFHASIALTHVSGDIFHHHDGIIDQQAERQDEAGDGQLVEAKSGHIKQRHADGQGQRDGNHDDAGGAQPQRQQRQQDQRNRDGEVLAKLAEAIGNVLRLIEAALEPDVRRQRPFEFRQPRVNAVTHLENIGVVFLVCRHEYGALAVESSGVGLLLGLPGDLGDVADSDLAAAACTDDGIGDLLERGVAAGGAQVVAPQSHIDRTPRHVLVLPLNRSNHLIETHADPREALQVNGHAHFGVGERPNLRGAHARHGFETILEVLSLFLQLPPAGGIADQRHLHDADESRAVLADVDLGDIGGQRGTDPVELADHLVLLLFRIAAVVKLRVHHGETVEGRALYFLDIFQRIDRIFDRFDDQALHVRRIRAGPDDADIRRREGKRGIFGTGNVGKARQAKRDQQREHHQRELPAPDRESPDAHRATTRTLSPFSRNAAPSVTTCAPALKPFNTSI